MQVCSSADKRQKCVKENVKASSLKSARLFLEFSSVLSIPSQQAILGVFQAWFGRVHPLTAVQELLSSYCEIRPPFDLVNKCLQVSFPGKETKVKADLVCHPQLLEFAAPH